MSEANLVIFDCDGVLIDSEILADRVVLEYCGEQFPQIDFSVWTQRMTGVRMRDILRMMESEHAIRFATDADDIILQRLDLCLMEEIQPIRGVAAALAAIDHNKAVVSNSYSEHVRRLLHQTGLLEYFAGQIFGADLVERPKPYPDLYLLAADTLRTHPDLCVVIEDSVPGTTAATAAGMRVIGFTGGSHSGSHHNERLLQAGAATVIASMQELSATLDDFLQQ